MRVRTLVPVLVLLLAVPLFAEESSDRHALLLARAAETAAKGAIAGTISFERGAPIDILAFSWGVSNSGSSTPGGGGAGQATFSDIVIIKELDKSSPQLMKSCAEGKRLKDAVISLKDGKGQTYLVVTMADVQITSYQTGGSGSDVVPVDSVSLNFARLSIDGILIGL